jgi:hypothetical protein
MSKGFFPTTTKWTLKMINLEFVGIVFESLLLFNIFMKVLTSLYV